jgi:hypothetical protein
LAGRIVATSATTLGGASCWCAMAGAAHTVAQNVALAPALSGRWRQFAQPSWPSAPMSDIMAIFTAMSFARTTDKPIPTVTKTARRSVKPCRSDQRFMAGLGVALNCVENKPIATFGLSACAFGQKRALPPQGDDLSRFRIFEKGHAAAELLALPGTGPPTRRVLVFWPFPILKSSVVIRAAGAVGLFAIRVNEGTVVLLPRRAIAASAVILLFAAIRLLGR